MAFLRRLRSRLKSLTSFQILSDLHLEVGQQYDSFDIPVRAPYLILAGDIGRLIDYDSYLDFLQRQVGKYRLVFLVLGNHEFYGITHKEGLEIARRLEGEEALGGRLVLLHQRRYELAEAGITVLGCTLWSHIPDASKEVVAGRINDFKRIKDWTTDDHNAIHESDLEWLSNQAQRISNERPSLKRVLVVTHHAPSLQDTSRPDHASNPWTCAFASEILGRDEFRMVHTWVFGHTHFSTRFRRDGVRVVSNQRGYALPGTTVTNEDGKDSNERFDIARTIEV